MKRVASFSLILLIGCTDGADQDGAPPMPGSGSTIAASAAKPQQSTEPTPLPEAAAPAPCPPEQYRWETVSPSRRYALEIENRFGDPGSTRIVVFDTVTGAVVSRIDPNPGGGVNGAFNVRFTANDNVLASWGCGTYCGVAALFTPRGQRLPADLQFYEVAPSGVFAIDYPAWSFPIDGTIELVDLRTGRSVHSEPRVRVPPVCCVTWGPHRAELHPCDGKGPPLAVDIPESLPVLEPAG